MRRSAQLLCLAVLFSGVFAMSAAAQVTPEPGAIAGGGHIGIFFPDEAFEKTISFEGFGEYYATPNVSLRFLLGYTSPGFENFTEDHFRQIRMLFNGVYYFRYNNWQPFVTGGAGAYFLRELYDQAPDPDSETRGGINFGFGTEYAVGTGATVRGELRWDIVSHPTGFSDATGMSLMFGYKRYF